MAKDNVKAIEQAEKLLETLKEDKEALRVYELRQKYLMDSASEKMTAREDGKEEGKKEGQKEKSIEIAKKMLKQGYDIKEVSKITEISEDELKEIK